MSAFIKALPIPIIVVFIFWCGGGEFKRGEALGVTAFAAFAFYSIGVFAIKEANEVLSK